MCFGFLSIWTFFQTAIVAAGDSLILQGGLIRKARFPREGGDASFTSGPKIVHFDRVEWHVQPDPATKAAALQAGEMDWWENPTSDLLPLMQAQQTIGIEAPWGTDNYYLLTSAQPIDAVADKAA